jgi:hypothetical protein
VNFIVSFIQAVSQNVAGPEEDLQEGNAKPTIIAVITTMARINFIVVI